MADSERCRSRVGSPPGWMSQDQWESGGGCQCTRKAGHDGEHACSHENTEQLCGQLVWISVPHKIFMERSIEVEIRCVLPIDHPRHHKAVYRGKDIWFPRPWSDPLSSPREDFQDYIRKLEQQDEDRRKGIDKHD